MYQDRDQKYRDAVAKARSYGRGEIQIKLLPPQGPRRAQKGICDYCNKERPFVIVTKTTLYLVCWRCVSFLNERCGDNWEEKVEARLFDNRQGRMQKEAQKKAS